MYYDVLKKADFCIVSKAQYNYKSARNWVPSDNPVHRKPLCNNYENHFVVERTVVGIHPD